MHHNKKGGPQAAFFCITCHEGAPAQGTHYLGKARTWSSAHDLSGPLPSGDTKDLEGPGRTPDLHDICLPARAIRQVRLLSCAKPTSGLSISAGIGGAAPTRYTAFNISDKAKIVFLLFSSIGDINLACISSVFSTSRMAAILECRSIKGINHSSQAATISDATRPTSSWDETIHRRCPSSVKLPSSHPMVAEFFRSLSVINLSLLSWIMSCTASIRIAALTTTSKSTCA